MARNPQAQEDTFVVKDRTSLDKVVVTADGDGVVSHAGSALLVGLADKVGLTGGADAPM